MIITTLYNQFKKIHLPSWKRCVSPRYYVVYKNRDGKIKTYQIGGIDLFSSFGNKEDNRKNVGFRAYCFGRKAVRSFRHDRIVSLTKK